MSSSSLRYFADLRLDHLEALGVPVFSSGCIMPQEIKTAPSLAGRLAQNLTKLKCSERWRMQSTPETEKRIHTSA
jgi:hypothetical protein